MLKEENDSAGPIEQFKLKVKEEGLVHQSLLEYLGLSAGEIDQQTNKDIKSEEIYRILKEKSILTNKSEFRDILKTISILWEKHFWKNEIKQRIENLTILLKNDIKDLFLEKELFDIFNLNQNRNRFIYLFLVEQNILSIETMINKIDLTFKKDWNIIKFFYPEIRKYNEKYLNDLMNKNDKEYGLKKFVEENDGNLEFFYEKRKEGEKGPKIVELIREDKIEEFILFIEQSPINLNNKIQKGESKFNKYTKNLTPIEYSALFGAISIFKYLYMKEVNINDSIIEYAIQGRNYEIIHLLEERKEIKEELNNQEIYQKCLGASITMHHNEIFEYFMTNYNYRITGDIIYLIVIFHNYQLFNQLIERDSIDLNDNKIITPIFLGVCENGNEEIVKLLINQPNLDINSNNIIFDQLLKVNKMNKKTIDTSREYL